MDEIPNAEDRLRAMGLTPYDGSSPRDHEYVRQYIDLVINEVTMKAFAEAIIERIERKYPNG